MVPELVLADAAERDDLGAFAARAVRLDGQSVVRLRNRDDELLDAWVATPFDALATRTVAGQANPADVTVSGSELLTGLAVMRDERIDPGPAKDLMWRSALPPVDGWLVVDRLPVEVVAKIADDGVEVARENTGPQGTPPASLLDQTVLTVSGSGLDETIPLPVVVGLSGMGVGGEVGVDVVAEQVPGDRIDARFGAVVRRRHSMLPLLV